MLCKDPDAVLLKSRKADDAVKRQVSCRPSHADLLGTGSSADHLIK